MEKKVLDAMKRAGKPVKPAEVAKLLGAESKEVSKVFDQLKKQGERVGVDVVAHQPGADPGAVVYDALQAAKSRQADILIIDTAGRLHTKVNLMNELSKVKRVIQKFVEEAPHEVLLILDGSTGMNAFEQARQFTDTIQVNALAVTKLDGTAKGGVIIGISDQFKVPVKYIGIGEKLEDDAFFHGILHFLTTGGHLGLGPAVDDVDLFGTQPEGTSC